MTQRERKIKKISKNMKKENNPFQEALLFFIKQKRDNLFTSKSIII